MGRLLLVLGLLLQTERIAIADGDLDERCVQDPSYVAAYAKLRSHWVRLGGVGGISIISEARVAIESAADLHRNARALLAHGRLKREGADRLRAWARSLEPKSDLAWYADHVAAQVEEDAQRIESLARAAAAMPESVLAGAVRALVTFQKAHPQVPSEPWGHDAERSWRDIPYEDEKPVIAAAEALHKHFGEPRTSYDFDGLALEFDSNESHQMFRPVMTWMGTPLPAASPVFDGQCPASGTVAFLMGGSQNVGSIASAYQELRERSLRDLARLSHLVLRIEDNYQTLSCLQPMRKARVRYRPEIRTIETDFVSRPSSCLDHWLGGYFRFGRGEASDHDTPTLQAIRAVFDQVLGPMGSTPGPRQNPR
jgi:hypothetical protein